MIVHDIDQGTEQWHLLRLGVPTASCFGRILTPTGKNSTQAETYMHELIAELERGVPENIESTEWMNRGNDLEPEARDWYEFDRDTSVQQVGFVARDGCGCSPDGMVGDDGLLEIKVPKPSTHVGYMLDDKLPTKYKPQVQGQLWVCERKWCDFVSYCPGMSPVVVRVERDEDYIKALSKRMEWFLDQLHEKQQRLIERGQLQADKEAA